MTRIERLVSRGRAFAESLMVDRCTIVRRGGSHTDDSGHITTDEQVVYAGNCKIQTAGGIGSESTALGGVTQIWSVYLHLPVTAVGLKPGDLATVTSLNPDADGKTFRLVNPQAEKTFATAVRWNVKEEA